MTDALPLAGAVVVLAALGAAALVASRRDRHRPPAAPVLVAVLALGAAQLLPPLSSGGRGAAAQGAVTVAAAVAVIVVQLQLLRRRLATSAARSWLDLATGLPGCLALVWAFTVPAVALSRGVSATSAALLLVPLGLSWLAVAFTITSAMLLRPPDRRMLLLALACVVLLTGEVGSASAASGQAWGDDLAALARPLAACVVVLASALRDPHEAVRAEESGFDIVIGPVALTAQSIALLGWYVASPTNPAMAWAALATVVMTLAKTVVVFQQLDALNALRTQATTDALTGLGNRRALEDALAAVDAGRPTALVVIDLDRFKAVNDALGHAAGDELLVELAARLLEEADDDDVVVRTGGDEFALVVPGGSSAAARDRAERVVAAVRLPVHVAGVEVEVGASAGVAAAPLHAWTAGGLREAADAAMYAAKTSPTGGGVVTAPPVAAVPGGPVPGGGAASDRAAERRGADRRVAERRGGPAR